MTAHLHLAPRSPEGEPVASPTPIRVVLADGHAGMRRSLRQLLDREEDLEVVAEASDAASVVSQVQEWQPRVLVFDLDMPGGSRIQAIVELRETARATRIVVTTMEDNPRFAAQALAAGALGFAAKDLADGELSPAIRAAAADEQYVSPRVAERLRALQRSIIDDALTPRGTEVLRLIALGHTSVEIARKMHLSARTIETQRAGIHERLGLATRAELVGYALRRGLIGT
jgi:two-component system response regulator NreC